MKYIHKNLLKDDASLGTEMAALFSGELNPVAPKAQKKVQIPEGLDLDAWINEPLSSESEEEDEKVSQLFPKCGAFVNEYNNYSAKNKVPEPTEEELAQVNSFHSSIFYDEQSQKEKNCIFDFFFFRGE